MSNRIWRGDAPEVCQVRHVRFPEVQSGKVFGLKIGNKSVQVTAGSDDADALVERFVQAIQDEAAFEWSEVAPSAGTDDAGETVLVLTASTCGRPVRVEVDTDVTDVSRIEIEETVPGRPGTNEIQKIEFVRAPTGGTFTLVWDPGTGDEATADIDYDATAADVEDALEGLPSIADGDVRVFGGPGPGSAWLVEFRGTYAQTDVNLIDVDGTNLQGAAEVEVTTSTEGGEGADAIHVLEFGFPDRFLSKYRLKYLGEWTGEIPAGANPESAIEALSAVGTGNVEVVGRFETSADSYGGDAVKGVWVVHFRGDLAGRDIGLPGVENLYGGGVAARVLQQGGVSNWNEWQWMDFDGVSPTFQVYYGGEWSGDVDVGDWRDGITRIDHTLMGLSTVDFHVQEHNWWGFTEKLAFVVLELREDTNREQAVIYPSTGLGTGYGTLLDGGSGGGTDEVQEVTVYATGGTFTLTFDGQTTGAIDHDAPASGVNSVEEALEALPNVTDVTVTGTGEPDDPYRVTFLDPGARDVPPMTADPTNLTGGDGKVTVTQGASGDTHEQQTITLDAGVTGGTFTLSFEGQETASIAYDAAAADVETALEGLSIVDGVSVAGNAGGPWTVTFDAGNVAARDVALLKVDASGLTGGSTAVALTEATRSGGPNHWDDPLNWTGGKVPGTGDVVWIDGGTPILYGLRQSTTFTADASSDKLTMADLADFVEGQKVRVSSTDALPAGLSAGTDYYVRDLDRDAQTLKLSATEGGAAVDITDGGTGTHTVRVELGSLNLTDTFTEQVGLPVVNEDGDYYEYRERALHVGLVPSGPTEVVIGGPEGSGPGLARFDFGGSQVDTLRVRSTGGSIEPSRPAVTVLGSALKKITVIAGHFGLAAFPSETAAVTELVVRGGEVEVGKGVTLTTLDKTGGLLRVDEATLDGTAIIE